MGVLDSYRYREKNILKKRLWEFLGGKSGRTYGVEEKEDEGNGKLGEKNRFTK